MSDTVTESDPAETEGSNSIYNIEQAAERLHISRRTLQDWLRSHPADHHGNPFYAKIGRRMTFDDKDIERIRAAAKDDERVRLHKSRPARAAARVRFEAHASGIALTRLQELLNEPPRDTKRLRKKR